MKTNKLYVKYNDKLVGILAITSDKKIAFEYSNDWLLNGFSLNPFSLPLKKGVFVPTKPYFDGLFGVFSDSLPDSWGNLLIDRFLLSHGINKNEINILDRLSIIGQSSMGALIYEPMKEFNCNDNHFSLDELSVSCSNILKSNNTENIDELFQLGGSSGGARPKVLINIDDVNWIIKFSNSLDTDNAGKMEYDYSLCAKECGINVPKINLFDSKLCDGFFGIERFDIKDNKRIHMVTVAGLLEVDFRSPCLDYNDLLKLTKILTYDRDTYEMYRRMCFNVFAHNRDDHAKNFTFLYDDVNKIWNLSPAYDLTYSTTYYGEHTTSINGKGDNISKEDLLEVGLKANLNKTKCLDIINSIEKCVNYRLKNYLNYK